MNRSKIYINGIGSISAQIFDLRSKNNVFTPALHSRMFAIEPDYKELLPPMQLRRMSKVVKLGVASAKSALQDAELTAPDIIITGTGYGCLADTENFLQKMISQKETLLTPTSFIQSTHNTVSGQIALMLACHGHNFTYVQRGHSFESALQESILWLLEKEQINVLTGGIDEMTNHSFEIISRFGTYKNDNELFNTSSKGTIAGEGSNIFILSQEKKNTSYAELVDIQMCSSDNISMELLSFLDNNNLHSEDIDTCLIGLNGDNRYDTLILQNMSELAHANFVNFKKWCGDYPTAGSFAMSLASNLLLSNYVPDYLTLENKSSDRPLENVLIYNHYKNKYHSFILLKAI